MNFMLIDGIILILLIYFGYRGYTKGLVRAIADIIKLVATFFISKELALQFANIISDKWVLPFIQNFLMDNIKASEQVEKFLDIIPNNPLDVAVSSFSNIIANNISFLIVFIILFIAINFLIGLIVGILDGIIKILYLSLINRIAGLILGVISAFIISSLVLNVIFVDIFKTPENNIKLQKTIITKHILNQEE